MLGIIMELRVHILLHYMCLRTKLCFLVSLKYVHAQTTVYWDIFESLYFCEFRVSVQIREILVGVSDCSLINSHR